MRNEHVDTDICYSLWSSKRQPVRDSVEQRLSRLEALIEVSAPKHGSPHWVPTIRLAIDTVTQLTGVLACEIIGPARDSRTAEARMLAYWLARRIMRKNFSEIARVIGGRDRTTVKSGVERIEELRDMDVRIHDLTEDLLILFRRAS